MRTILMTLLTAFTASAALAAAAPSADMAWVRHVPGQKNAAAYLTITASENDSLTGVESECCSTVEIHEMKDDDGVLRMRTVDAVALPASTPVKFAPLGYHIMLIGLKQPPAEGTAIPIKLVYGSGVSEIVPFLVKTVGAQPAPAAMDSHEHHGHH